MKQPLLLTTFLLILLQSAYSQSCGFGTQITTNDSLLCLGQSTTLVFNVPTILPADTTLATPIVNNNGQDGNMFDITAINSIRIRSFEGNIANTPNPSTEYYIYYKVGTHVGFENNAAAWTLVAGPLNFNPNAPNALSLIPANINITIPAGLTYAFYLTNTAAASNNNRYSTGTATGNTWAQNVDFIIREGTGGAYPFGTFFNARPWEGKVNYDYPPNTYLWNNGETTSSITVQPTTTTGYSCVATLYNCTAQDTITVQVNNPTVDLGNDIVFCDGDSTILTIGNPAYTANWCSGQTTETITATTAGLYCVTVTDELGCTDSDSVSVTVNPLPSINAGIDQIVCAGNSVTLTASGTDSYTWNNAILNGVSFVPSGSNTYIVTATDTNSCVKSDTVSVTVNPLPTIHLGADITSPTSPVTLDAGAGFANYVWNTQQNTQTISVNTSGDYFVTVTDNNNCSNSDTISVFFTTGISSLNHTEASIKLYPNPASDLLYIDIQNLETDDLSLMLIDLKGSTVETFYVGKVSGAINQSLDIQRLHAGIYILRMQTNGAFTQLKFVKN